MFPYSSGGCPLALALDFFTSHEPFMKNNPFDPPKANVDVVGLPSKPPAYVIAAVSAIQMLCFVVFFPFQFELVRTGAMHAMGPFIAVIANLLLLLGIALLMVKRKGKTVFLVSGLGFFLATILVWNMPISPLLKHSIYSLGTLIALFSWWVTRRYQIELLKFQTISQLGQ